MPRPFGDEPLQLSKLMDSDRRLDVAQVVLEPAGDDVVAPAAPLRIAVPGVLADAVEAQQPHPPRQGRIVSRHHSAFARRQVLCRVEAVDDGIAACPVATLPAPIGLPW